MTFGHFQDLQYISRENRFFLCFFHLVRPVVFYLKILPHNPSLSFERSHEPGQGGGFLVGRRYTYVESHTPRGTDPEASCEDFPPPT